MNPRAALWGETSGMISQYNLDHDEMVGARNLTHINRKRIRMQGFIVSDHNDRLDEFMDQMAGWLKSGEIKYRVDITDGLGNAPAAFIAMLKGQNFGKQVVRIDRNAP
ncbi:MAG: zinc-binding dehydrogenase [Planctomycetaceae bacterium]|nr:zinc-binding dehydrogenase [Planctomycetaceae bacterium]